MQTVSRDAFSVKILMYVKSAKIMHTLIQTIIASVKMNFSWTIFLTLVNSVVKLVKHVPVLTNVRLAQINLTLAQQSVYNAKVMNILTETLVSNVAQTAYHVIQVQVSVQSAKKTPS